MVRRRLRPSDARAAGDPGRICAAGRARRRRSQGIVALDHRRHRAARRRAGAARERGAVPADRQFGAGDDVGDPARPHPRLRQRRLCRVRRRSTARRRGSSTGGRGSTPTTSTGSSPRAIAGEASARAVHARGRAIAGTTASVAGCAACRSRGSAPDGRADRLHRRRRATSRWPRRPSSSFRRQVEERTAELAQSERGSARSSTRCWK